MPLFSKYFVNQLSLYLFLLYLLSLSCSYQPTFNSSEIPSDIIITENRKLIEIKPESTPVAPTGLLFYPGGLVDNHAYNKLLSRFSRNGIFVVIVKMPANLAVFDIEAGISVIDNYPQITRWVVAGHSLGGAMAASLVNRNRELFDGIIFMDSYPPDGDGFADWRGVVLSLFSSKEKVSDSSRMSKTLSLLPPAFWLTTGERMYPHQKSNYTVIHVIEGGSHSLFGSYGPQDGDFTPTVSEYDFQSEVIENMLEFFTKNNWR